jgi:hypothetical protein
MVHARPVALGNPAKSKFLPPLFPVEAESSPSAENSDVNRRQNPKQKGQPGEVIPTTFEASELPPIDPSPDDNNIARPVPILKLVKRNVKRLAPAQG